MSTKLNSFPIIGIAVRTSNANGQAAQDIGQLWNRFLSENVIAQIPNKASGEIYSVYCEYEGDHNMPYTCLLGCKVESMDDIPEGMKAITIQGGDYKKVTTRGSMKEGFVYQAWDKIWQSDLNRNYQTDFEIYGEKAQNPEDAEVDILVGVKA